MKIISWNINGIRANYKKGFLDFIKKQKPDIFCAQEIKAEIDQFPENVLALSGYEYFINPAKKKGYSGTMVLSKQKPEENSFFLDSKKFDEEGRIIRLDFKKFTLINFYIPHGGRKKENLDYKLEAYEKISSLLKKIKKKNMILIGDFNIAHKEIDLARPKDNKNNIMFTSKERKIINKIIDLGFVDTFRHLNKKPGNYSWWPYFRNARERNLGWRIDYVFVSRPLIKKVKRAFILKNIYGSDHCPVGIELEV